MGSRTHPGRTCVTNGASIVRNGSDDPSYARGTTHITSRESLPGRDGQEPAKPPLAVEVHPSPAQGMGVAPKGRPPHLGARTVSRSEAAARRMLSPSPSARRRDGADPGSRDWRVCEQHEERMDFATTTEPWIHQRVAESGRVLTRRLPRLMGGPRSVGAPVAMGPSPVARRASAP